MKKPYFLIDIDTTNLVGSYSTEKAALRAVAETAGRYGRRSEAANTLALIRGDLPAGKGLIARGPVLVRRALAACDPASGQSAPARGKSVVDRVGGAVSKMMDGVARPGPRRLSAPAAATGRFVTSAAAKRAGSTVVSYKKPSKPTSGKSEPKPTQKSNTGSDSTTVSGRAKRP